MVNKKVSIVIITLLIIGFIFYLLFSSSCAPCTYRYGNRDYTGVCTEICIPAPKWKLLLFNLTGINLDYKDYGGIKLLFKYD